MAGTPLELSIILPAYNEGPYIKDNIQTIKAKADACNVSYEIIIVNDGSGDDTLQKARECESEKIRVLTYEKNRGKGYAVRHGMLNADGMYHLFMDVDLSTSLDAMDKFLNLIRSSSVDIVIGNRKSDPALQKIKQPFYRRFFGDGFTRLSSFIIGRNVKDFTCGFKMYTKDASRLLFKRQQIFDWAFDTELIYIATLHNLKVCEAPVLWSHHGDSKVRLIQNIIHSFYSLIKMRLNGLKGLYK